MGFQPLGLFWGGDDMKFTPPVAGKAHAVPQAYVETPKSCLEASGDRARPRVPPVADPPSRNQPFLGHDSKQLAVHGCLKS